MSESCRAAQLLSHSARSAEGYEGGGGADVRQTLYRGESGLEMWPRGKIDLRMKSGWMAAGPLRRCALAMVGAGIAGWMGAGAQAQTSQSAQPPAVQTTAAGRAKLAAASIASYDNKYEVFGGLNFLNGQAGQTLPKRYNLGGGDVMGTYWLTSKLGAAADYRIDAGTTPVLSPYYNRVLVTQQIVMGGVQYRGPKGRYAAVDYHALAGITHGVFDSAIKGYPGGSPVTAAQVGLYPNKTALNVALGASVDFNYSRNLAVRVQPDLILERFGTELREFVSVSGGVVYRFGRR